MVKAKKISEGKLSLEAQKREIFGKQLNKVRKQGLVPANVYGPQFKSVAVSVNLRDFIKTYKVARETGIVYVKLGVDEIPVLTKNLQYHPVTNILLHVDFRKIDLKQKIQTEVPVKVVGQSEAVNQKSGVLLTQLNKLVVEALPEDIPQAIEVDISVLKEIGQEIKVFGLVKSTKYEIKTEAEKIIVSVIAHKEESITPEVTAATPEVITAKTEEEAVPESGKPAPAATSSAEKGEKPKPVEEKK